MSDRSDEPAVTPPPAQSIGRVGAAEPGRSPHGAPTLSGPPGDSNPSAPNAPTGSAGAAGAATTAAVRPMIPPPRGPRSSGSGPAALEPNAFGQNEVAGLVDRSVAGPLLRTTSEGSSQGDGPATRKRRRGARGGQGRRSAGGTRDVVADAANPELPDPPHEGQPASTRAAAVSDTSDVSDSPDSSDSSDSSDSPDSPDSSDISATTVLGPTDGPRRRGRRGPQAADGDEGSVVVIGTPTDTDRTAERDAVKPLNRPGARDGERAPGRQSEGGRGDRGTLSRSKRSPGAVRGGLPSEVVLVNTDNEARRGRERNGRPVGRFMMCVSVGPGATQIAVLEGRQLIEHYVSRPADLTAQIHGNIYRGRVQNVLPGMEAAFVDIGTPKNGVLYRGDVQYDQSDIDTKTKARDVRIEQLLKNGNLITCQVTKNPIGAKGARLTQEVSLPGRFVVLVPNSDTYGISKRLPDDERKRLRRILDEVRPAGHGIIVRTAAEGATADELGRDVKVLLAQWTRIEARAKTTRGPSLLYREPDMALRVIREEFNKEYRGIVIDDRTLYDEVRSYVASISPELEDRVEFYDPSVEALPLFERHHVHEQLHKALDRKVWLPSGGSVIIERTEALTVIDVNTGRNVGSSTLEETVFRNNLEAADEVARQLRLRDIGGIIVIDFIDMETRANREALGRAFRDALARDKTRTQVFDVSELGLIEMTRKRIGEGLVESLSTLCPTCDGRGSVPDPTLIEP
jgi:ribonuclease E